MTARRTLIGLGAAATLGATAGGAVALPSGPSSVVNAGGFTPVIASTGQSLTVDLRANRTIIDWSSFDIAAGETVTFAFDNRSWIALNRVSGGPISVNGQLNALLAPNSQTTGPPGGNIWLYSPGGVAFGANARVDVGGLLATSSSPDQALFLVSQSLSHTLTGDGSGGPVTVAGGARMTAAGHLSFLAPRVTTGAGAVFLGTAERSSITYGAADSYSIRFRLITGGDMSLVDFVVPSAAVGTNSATPLDLAGDSQAANVFLLATGCAGLASVLINAPGLLVARSSLAGEGQVKIGTGRQMTGADFDFQQEVRQVPGAPPGFVTMGTAQADSYITILLAGDSALGDLTADGLSAGSTLGIGARNVTIGPGGLRMADQGLGAVGEIDIVVDASGNVTIPSASSTEDITIFRGVHQTGRSVARPNIQLGAASAGDRIGLFGDVTVAGTLTAGALFDGNNNNLQVTSVTAPTVNLTGLAGAPLRIGVLTASGQATLTTTGPVDLGTATVGGLSLTSGAAVLNALTASGSVIIDTGALTLGSTRIAGDARLVTSSPDFTAAFEAPNLTVESRSGAITVGGSGLAGLSASDLRGVRVTGALNIYAGVNVQGGARGDLTVLDFEVDASRIPQLNLFAGVDNSVLVQGRLTAARPGGALQIGASEADSPWAPRQILVSGSIGAASGDAAAGFTDVRAFDSVKLHATRDILVGSQRFLDLIVGVPAAEIDIGRSLPMGVAAQGDEIGKLYLVAGNLTLTASDRIVQQNTGVFGLEGGLYLTGVGVDADEPILVIGRAQVADLFGAFDSGDGVLAIGGAGAFSSRIARLEGDTSQGRIRINGCLLGLGCALSTPASQFRVQQFRPAGPRAAVDPPVLTPPPPIDDDEGGAEAVTTGAGNEEIWRKDQQ